MLDMPYAEQLKTKRKRLETVVEGNLSCKRHDRNGRSVLL